MMPQAISTPRAECFFEQPPYGFTLAHAGRSIRLRDCHGINLDLLEPGRKKQL